MRILICGASWRGAPARPGSAGRQPGSPGVVHPLDAGSAPVQAVDGVAAVLGHRGLLPHRGDRRRARAFPGRACPPACGAAKVANPPIHPFAVRGDADSGPRVAQPVRLRISCDARPARAEDLRGNRRQHRRSGRGARPPGAPGPGQGRQDGARTAAACGQTGYRPRDRRPISRSACPRSRLRPEPA